MAGAFAVQNSGVAQKGERGGQNRFEPQSRGKVGARDDVPVGGGAPVALRSAVGVLVMRIGATTLGITCWLAVAVWPGTAWSQEDATPQSAELSPAAGGAGPIQPCAGTRRNRPPKLKPSVSIEPRISAFVSGRMALRSQREARITLHAEDPDQDQLTFRGISLPTGARLDVKHGVITWSPTRQQEGEHRIEVEVTDGEATDRNVFLLVVVPNRAPRPAFSGYVTRVVPDRSPSNRGAKTQLASDPDADPVTFRGRQLPPGARLEADGAVVSLVWEPTEQDLGEHEVVVDVSDGVHTTEIRTQAMAFPNWAQDDYTGWLLLGSGPSAFITHADREVFVGGAIDITVVALRGRAASGYSCSRRATHYDCHASHHRFYGEFEVLAPTRARGPSVFTYGFGYSASFEYAPLRRYFIPHYGVEVGGLVREGVGHRAQTRPYLGLHLFASTNVWVNATAGYRVVPADLRDLSGPTVALRAVLTPW